MFNKLLLPDLIGTSGGMPVFPSLLQQELTMFFFSFLFPLSSEMWYKLSSSMGGLSTSGHFNHPGKFHCFLITLVGKVQACINMHLVKNCAVSCSLIGTLQSIDNCKEII